MTIAWAWLSTGHTHKAEECLQLLEHSLGTEMVGIFSERDRAEKIDPTVQLLLVEIAVVRIELAMELPADTVGWVAARTYGANGSAAHTTPIYITRDGKPYWNPARAPKIIQRQLAVLDEIEAVVDDAVLAQREQRLAPLDFWSLRIAKGADKLRALTDQSRALYSALQERVSARQ